MIIRDYMPEDRDFILHGMDGRYSKRREDNFDIVDNCSGFGCLVAEEDSVIKGFVIMRDRRDGVSYYMEQINVAEKRRGIGRELVREVFRRIGPGGHITLCVNSDNEEAIRFYESMGFQWSGFTRGYRKDQNKLWFQIDL